MFVQVALVAFTDSTFEHTLCDSVTLRCLGGMMLSSAGLNHNVHQKMSCGSDSVVVL